MSLSGNKLLWNQFKRVNEWSPILCEKKKDLRYCRFEARYYEYIQEVWRRFLAVSWRLTHGCGGAEESVGHDNGTCVLKRAGLWIYRLILSGYTLYWEDFPLDLFFLISYLLLCSFLLYSSQLFLFLLSSFAPSLLLPLSLLLYSPFLSQPLLSSPLSLCLLSLHYYCYYCFPFTFHLLVPAQLSRGP